MSPKEIVQKFYKSDALIDSEVMKDFIHPDLEIDPDHPVDSFFSILD